MSKLIAIHSIQTYDEKAKRRVDIKPGQEFEPSSAKEAGDLIAAGAAREAKKGEKGNVDAGTSADGLPTPPAGYAPGTATNADVNLDPNAEGAVDLGSADSGAALGEAATGRSSTSDTRTSGASTSKSSAGPASTSKSR